MNHGHAKLNSNCKHDRKVKEFQRKGKERGWRSPWKEFYYRQHLRNHTYSKPLHASIRSNPLPRKSKEYHSIRPPLFCRRRGRGRGGGVGLGHGLELLEVEPDDSVREEARVLLAVAVGDVDDV